MTRISSTFIFRLRFIEYLEFPLDVLSRRCGSSRTLEVRMFGALRSRLLQHEVVTQTSRLRLLRHLVWLTRWNFS